MARDRLAAIRAQQGGQYDNISEPSYPTQPTQQPPSTTGRRANVFAQPQPQVERYEMEDRNPPASANANGAGYGDGDLSNFYSEVSSIQEEIRTFNNNVQQISELHSRSLNNVDDEVSRRNASQLEALVEDTAALSSVLKRRIKALQRQAGSGREAQIKKNQIGLVNTKFVEAIQNYQEVERQYRAKYKQRVERQFRIVKPDATPEEVKSVVEDENGAQIFSQALMSSNRYGESRAAYREVQERHADIRRIEKTLTELAQLVNDMSTVLEQQGEIIDVIEGDAAVVEKDLETGVQHTDKAVDSARAARKKRWICFLILLLIVVIIGVALAITLRKH